MEETIREMIRECNVSFSTVEGEISDIVRQSQYHIINRLVEILHESLSFINENHVTDLVISSYLPQVISFMKKNNEKNMDNLLESIRSLQGLSSMGKTPEQLSSIISMRTHEIIRRQNPEQLYDYNMEFAYELTRAILRRLEQTPIFSQSQLDNLYDELRPAIKTVLNKESDKLFEQYSETLSSSLKRFLNKSEEQIIATKKSQDNKKTAEYSCLKNSEENLAKLGIDVLDLFDTIQIKSDASRYMTLYETSSGSLTTQDKSIEITIINANDIVLKRAGRTIHYTDNFISFGRDNYPEQSMIERVEGTFNIYYGGTLITDPIKQNVVIERLRKNYPLLYDNMMLDNNFKAMVDMISMSDEMATPYIVGENSKPIFKEELQEQYYEIFSSIGFKVSNEEDGFYLTDELGKHRVIGHSSYLTIEDKPGFVIKPCLYIVVEKRISGPFFEIETPDYSVIASQDYSSVSLFSGDYHFSLLVNGDELKATQEDRKSNRLVDENQPVIERMQTIIPGLVAKTMGVVKQKEEGITDLLNELDSNVKTPDEVASIENAVDIDQELENLLEDPNVKRYIELMKTKSEQEELSTPSGLKM